MSGRIVVVGSLNMDVAVRTARLPQPGETLLATSVLRSGGGKGANQAVAAARAGGAATSMVGAVGTDGDGDSLLDALRLDGVDVGRVRRLPDHPTGMALITIDAAAENTIVVAAGANGQVTVTEEDRALLGSADVVLAQLEIPQPAVVAAARQRRPGSRFVLNAAPSATLDPELAGLVDLLVVNEHEAVDLAGIEAVEEHPHPASTGHPPPLEEAILRLRSMVPAVLVTLGRNGARLVSSDGTDVHVAAPAVQPVDTVAAGDTFCGVYAAAVADGVEEVQAVQRACAAASLAIQRRGAQASIPTLEETLEQTRAVYG